MVIVHFSDSLSNVSSVDPEVSTDGLSSTDHLGNTDHSFQKTKMAAIQETSYRPAFVEYMKKKGVSGNAPVLNPEPTAGECYRC